MNAPSPSLLSVAERRAIAIRIAPILRGEVSSKRPQVGRFLDTEALRAFIAQAEADAELKAVTGIEPVRLDAAGANSEEAFAAQWAALNGSLKGAALFLMPDVGAFVFAADAAQLMQRVMRIESILEPRGLGAAAKVVDAVAPARRGPLTGKIALVTGATSGIGLAIARRLIEEGACVTLAGHSTEKVERVLAELHTQGLSAQAHGLCCEVNDEADVTEALEAVCLQWCGLDILVNNAGLSIGKPLLQTSVEDYDIQNSVMPRGSFLCSREAARVLARQGSGGDIVYIVSKNALFAGPNNVAYGTAKAAQLHQARLLAVELAPLQIRVNVVNPDAVVQGSGIFSSGWGADRAQAYGIDEKELGKFYASRSLLKLEIFPEDIAAAVFVLVGPELRKSTGLIINVDSGFSPSMPR